MRRTGLRGQLASFGDALAACETVPEVLEVVTRRAAVLVGEGSVLALVSDDGAMLLPTAFHHDDPAVLASMSEALSHPLPVGTGVAGSVVVSRVPAVYDATEIDELTRALAPEARAFAARHPIRALIVVPMVGYGEVVGTLGVVRVESSEPYSAEALLVLEALADRAALAVAETSRAPHRLTAADYEAIFTHSVDGVLFTRPDGRILAANPAACSILRRSERDICLVGRRGLVVDDERARAAVATRGETGYARSDLTMRRGDGTTFVADVSSTVFTNDAGEVRACVTFRDVSEQVRMRAELEEKTRSLARLAREDELTKLRNRRGLAADAEPVLAIADRDGVPVQIVFFDIDGLKLVNDRHGHDAGDEVLRHFAAALRDGTRASDVTARIGGDEFVAVLYGADRATAEATVQRLATACAASFPPLDRVCFSHGLVERGAGSTTSLDHLLHEADQRMYERKAARHAR